MVDWDGAVSLPRVKELPAVPGVYAIWVNCQFAYVGQSANLHTRFGGHHRKAEIQRMGKRPVVYWKQFEPGELLDREAEYIQALQPSLNGHRIEPPPSVERTIKNIRMRQLAEDFVNWSKHRI